MTRPTITAEQAREERRGLAAWHISQAAEFVANLNQGRDTLCTEMAVKHLCEAASALGFTLTPKPDRTEGK